MGRIHFIGGEKGGVGKSLVARLLAQRLIDRNMPFKAFDTDRSHASLLRYYADFADLVEVEQAGSLDRIAEAGCESPDLRVLVDLAAQTSSALWRWVDDSRLAEAGEDLGFSMAWWHVMDAGRDSAEVLRQLLDRGVQGMDLVVCLNEIRGERFELFDSLGLRARAEEAGAKIVHIRKMQDDTMRRIDASGASFWAALNPADPARAALGILERRRVKTWMEQCAVELDRAGI
jgi:hypothetical protein